MNEVFGLDVEAWERWLQYRKAIKKPLKPVSYEAAQKRLAAFGYQQAAVVEQSIANGWQGLFPLKDVSRGASRQIGKSSSRYEESTERLRRWAEGHD